MLYLSTSSAFAALAVGANTVSFTCWRIYKSITVDHNQVIGWTRAVLPQCLTEGPQQQQQQHHGLRHHRRITHVHQYPHHERFWEKYFSTASVQIWNLDPGMARLGRY